MKNLKRAWAKKLLKNIAANGWGLTKFKKYQMKKIKETFLKFCLSPCYVSVKFLIIIFCVGF